MGKNSEGGANDGNLGAKRFLLALRADVISKKGHIIRQTSFSINGEAPYSISSFTTA